MDTKRKIILALDMTIEEKDRVFVREDDAVFTNDDGDDEPGNEPG